MKSLKYEWRVGAFYFTILKQKHPEHNKKKAELELMARAAHVLKTPGLKRQIEPGVTEDVEERNIFLRQSIRDAWIY